jgi:hypothetical protein
VGSEPNRFSLPSTDKVDVVLVDVHWFKLAKRMGVLQEAWRRLDRAAGLIVGVDGFDTVRLGAPPEMIDRCEIVLKSPGLYRDLELYNYEVGPYFPCNDWWSKRCPSSRRYSSAQLSKLRPVPYFASLTPVIRRLIRARLNVSAGTRALRGAGDLVTNALCAALRRSNHMRQRGVHFVGSLNHYQRLVAAELLAEARIPGTYGLTDVPDFVFGTPYRTAPVPEDTKNGYWARIRSHRLDRPRTSRPGYLVAMQRHQCALAITGYGEVTHRHAEALTLGVPLVSQDLSGIDTGFPFEHGRNVLFCRPDLSNLVSTVRHAQSTEGASIGDQGAVDWRAWARDPLALLSTSIVGPIRESL